MYKNFIYRRIFRVIVVLIVFGALVFFNPKNIFNPVRSVFLGIFYPFQKLSYVVSLKVAGAKSFVFSISDLKKENERLIEENQKLLAEDVLLEDIKKENDLLREQLKLLPRDELNLIPAWTIAQDSFSQGSWMMIDKGKLDGVTPNMSVIVSAGHLVGQVEEVFASSSKVKLITHPQSVINVGVVPSEAKGIVKGKYGLGLMLDMVLETDNIEAGNKIITSGISGHFPRGLLVGEIQSINVSSDHLFQQAVVKPYVDSSHLRLVFVVKD